MDALINAAALALAKGDPLGALNRVALREDPPALALRGIAMAQLGDLVLASALLKRAARAFGAREAVARARCVVAQTEIALVSRDLSWSPQALANARETLEAHGDQVNAVYARYLEVRRDVLIGRLDEAEHNLGSIDAGAYPVVLAANLDLLRAGIAMRRLHTRTAHKALTRAQTYARNAVIPALVAEVDAARELLTRPAARLIAQGGERLLLLEEVEALVGSDALIVDACRNLVRQSGTVVPLTSRPLVFMLLRLLAVAYPADVPRDKLITAAFRSRYIDQTHRARLRVEIGRLREAVNGLATVHAGATGYRLSPLGAGDVCVLAPPVDGQHAALLALLSDGESWTSSALALALNVSQRTVQRMLEALAATGQIQSLGAGRTRRWMSPPIPGFPTALLLPAPLPGS